MSFTSKIKVKHFIEQVRGSEEMWTDVQPVVDTFESMNESELESIVPLGNLVCQILSLLQDELNSNIDELESKLSDIRDIVG